MISLHTDTLTIDTDDVLIDMVDAGYEVDAIWGRRVSSGYRCIEHVNSIHLLWWGKSKRNRELAVLIAGEEAVAAEEERALQKWQERAVEDEADEYADYIIHMAAE